MPSYPPVLGRLPVPIRSRHTDLVHLRFTDHPNRLTLCDRRVAADEVMTRDDVRDTEPVCSACLCALLASDSSEASKVSGSERPMASRHERRPHLPRRGCGLRHTGPCPAENWPRCTYGNATEGWRCRLAEGHPDEHEQSGDPVEVEAVRASGDSKGA